MTSSSTELTPAASAHEQSLSNTPTVIAGTGVTMTLPPGVNRGPVGASFADAGWQVVVQVQTETVPKDVGDALRREYPSLERLRLGNHEAFLVREGTMWRLFVIDGERGLRIDASDRGSPPNMEGLRAALLGVRWDPRQIDAELSFGATVGPVEGMVLDANAAGSLVYLADDPIVRLTFTGGASPPNLDSDSCRASLLKIARRRAKPDATTEVKNIEGRVGCELQLVDQEGRAVYIACLQGPDGGMVTAQGFAPTSQAGQWHRRFAAAVRQLRSVPKR